MSKTQNESAGATAADRKITCPHYEALPGSRRCRSYVEGGACARPDTFMCIEWLRANGHAAPAPASPLPSTGSSPAPLVPPPDAVVSPRPFDAALVRHLDDAEIASLKSLGATVCIESDTIGALWIVPEYTGADRRELSIEHAATLAAICAVFPGARLVAFEKPARTSPDASGEPPRAGVPVQGAVPSRRSGQ